VRDHVFLTIDPGFVIGMLQCGVLPALHEPRRKFCRRFETGDDLEARAPQQNEEEIIMINKTKTALVAALVLSSASTAFAVDVTRNADRDRGFTSYQESAPAQQPRGQVTRGQLIEGRNVGVGFDQFVPAEQKRSYDRNAIDFNS
jgi:hypothetical protein